MKKLFGKLFGAKKESQGAVEVIGDVLQTILDLSKIEVSFDVERDDDNNIFVELFGADEESVVAKDGVLLDAFQLYLKRVVQHQFPDERLNINVDCGGFRENANQSLIELADKLKGIVMDRGKPVYFRALPPRDRKVVHQRLAEDGKVKSRSIGDGLYKKIKIYPVKGEASSVNQSPTT